MNTRPLSEGEKSLIARFAEKLDDAEKEQLLADAAHAMAKNTVADGSIMLFEIVDYPRRPPYGGRCLFRVEGKMLDSDNAELSVLLHADENGRLLELEFIRWDSNDLLSPQWDTLQVF
jgi:hypothetical protein